MGEKKNGSRGTGEGESRQRTGRAVRKKAGRWPEQRRAPPARIPVQGRHRRWILIWDRGKGRFYASSSSTARWTRASGGGSPLSSSTSSGSISHPSMSPASPRLSSASSHAASPSSAQLISRAIFHNLRADVLQMGGSLIAILPWLSLTA